MIFEEKKGKTPHQLGLELLAELRELGPRLLHGRAPARLLGLGAGRERLLNLLEALLVLLDFGAVHVAGGLKRGLVGLGDLFESSSGAFR